MRRCSPSLIVFCPVPTLFAEILQGDFLCIFLIDHLAWAHSPYVHVGFHWLWWTGKASFQAQLYLRGHLTLVKGVAYCPEM